jgi:hypothetical protein
MREEFSGSLRESMALKQAFCYFARLVGWLGRNALPTVGFTKMHFEILTHRRNTPLHNKPNNDFNSMQPTGKDIVAPALKIANFNTF